MNANQIFRAIRMTLRLSRMVQRMMKKNKRRAPSQDQV